MSGSPSEPVGPPEVDPAELRELWSAAAPTAEDVAVATARIGARVGTGGGLAGVLLKALGVLGAGAGLTLAVLGTGGTPGETGVDARNQGRPAATIQPAEGSSTFEAAQPQDEAPEATVPIVGGPGESPTARAGALGKPTSGPPLARGVGPAVVASKGSPGASQVQGGVAAPDGESPSWGAIASALEERDQAEVRRQLELLGGSDDPHTQAKARLGLAQLELSRGNRVRAVELAQEVIAAPRAGESLRRRARSLVVRARAPGE